MSAPTPSAKRCGPAWITPGAFSTSPTGQRAPARSPCFCASRSNSQRTPRPPHPAISTFVISDAPFIAPLTEFGPVGHVCVALVDERFARVLRGSAEQLHEALSFGDDVHGRQDQGGWSQARYQRSRHEDVKAHLRHVAATLHRLLTVAPYDHLLIACTEQLWPRMVEELHPDVLALLHGERLSLDVGDAGIEDVVRATEAVLAEEHHSREDAALAQLRGLRAVMATSGRLSGSRGWLVRWSSGASALSLPGRSAEVRRPLPSLRFDGYRWRGMSAGRRPAGARTNIVEDAVHRRSASPRRSCHCGRPELDPFGDIAATLRIELTLYR